MKSNSVKKERFFYILNNSKHSICTARCVIFDIFAHCENAKMLVGDNPQTPYFMQRNNYISHQILFMATHKITKKEENIKA